MSPRVRMQRWPSSREACEWGSINLWVSHSPAHCGLVRTIHGMLPPKEGKKSQHIPMYADFDDMLQCKFGRHYAHPCNPSKLCPMLRVNDLKIVELWIFKSKRWCFGCSPFALFFLHEVCMLVIVPTHQHYFTTFIPLSYNNSNFLNTWAFTILK